MLSFVLLAHLGIAAWTWTAARNVAGELETGTLNGRGAEFVGLRWEFQARDRGLFVAAPFIDGDRVYAAAASPGFNVGTLYCLDRATGRELWKFMGGGELKNMISSPCVAEGRVYLGEGFHDDANCKLWCVDAASGKQLWSFPTQGQTESSPTVALGKVYFGAGNEGLYCVSADKGKELWRFPDPGYKGRLLRFGAGPTAAGGRLYAATGIDRNKLDTDPGETALFCLDCPTGKLLWKTPMPHAAWGPPVLSSGQVFIGTGTGDIFEDAKGQASGALVCCDAKTGSELWRYKLANGVIDQPAVDAASAYVGCRDGHVHCVDRKKGDLRWKTNVDSPVVAAPALAQWCGDTKSVLGVGSAGKICCLDPTTGAVQWTYNLTDRKPHLSAAPKIALSRVGTAEHRQIYVGAGIGDVASGRAVIYCLEDMMRQDSP